MSASTLLNDAFQTARTYWIENNGGSRAGLIAQLVAALGVTQQKATAWTDAMTSGAFDMGFTDDTTYATFKARLIVVGATRGIRLTGAVFTYLTGAALLADATDQLLAQNDEQVAAVNVLVDGARAAVAAVAADVPEPERTTALVSLTDTLTKYQRSLDALARDRARILAA